VTRAGLRPARVGLKAPARPAWRLRVQIGTPGPENTPNTSRSVSKTGGFGLRQAVSFSW